MRPLVLHVSALNDSEYPLYISSLRDLAESDPDAPAAHDDFYYEGLKIGVREARAWLRGRYSTIAPPVVDSVLRLFCPNLGHADAINGGQFFAVLRLITHVLHGKQVDPSLVFVQAHPGFPSSPPEPTPPPPAQSTVFDPPSPDVNPFFTPAVEKPSAPAPVSVPESRPAVPPVPPKPNTNPFLLRRPSAPGRTSLEGKAPPVPGRSSLEGKTPPLPPRKPAAPVPPPRHSSMVVQPPLPRGSTHHGLPTNSLIQQSLQAGRVAQSLKKAEERLEKERVLEVLKSSVPAARRTRSISPPKELPGSSSPKSGSASSLERDRRPTLPPRPKVSPPASLTATARSFEQVAHATVSTSPFRQRDAAYQRSQGSLSKTVCGRSPSPPRPLIDLPAEPPPMHPDRKPMLSAIDSVPPSPDSPHSPHSAQSSHSLQSPRMLRSKSMHQPSPPPTLPPPRRRPGSVQLTPSPSTVDLSSAAASPMHPSFPGNLPSVPPSLHAHSYSQGQGLSRHLSLSSSSLSGRPRPERDAQSEGSPIAHLQKTLAGLHQRAQPHLESARYKAEAGLTRRGFVQHQNGPRWMMQPSEERLVATDSGGSAGDAGLGMDEGSVEQDLDVDTGPEEPEGQHWEERLRRLQLEEGPNGNGDKWRRERVGVERDNLKWPVGEGWRPL